LGIFAIFLAAFAGGMNISAAPSYTKAKMAANKIFEIIEEKSPIDTMHPKGEVMVKEGSIEFKEVDFRYPSRK
jgi:ABC-type multidrug transport system fused ATPase/permease subunit